jgi:hypothetical protein
MHSHRYRLIFTFCELIDLSFSQEVIRGTVHSHSDTGNVSFVPITPSSCQVQGYIVTDKVAGNFKFKIKSTSEDLINDLFVQQFGQQFGQITRGVKETDPDMRSPPHFFFSLSSILLATPSTASPSSKLLKTKWIPRILIIHCSS